MKDIMLYPSNNCDYDSIISGHFDNMVNIGVSQKKIKKNIPNREELRNKLKSEMFPPIVPLKPFLLDKFSRRRYFLYNDISNAVVTISRNNHTTIGNIESVVNHNEPPQLVNPNPDNEDNLSISGESNSLEQSDYNSEDIDDQLPPLEQSEYNSEDVGDELPPLPELNEEFIIASNIDDNLDDNLDKSDDNDSIADVDGQWEDNLAGEWETSNGHWNYSTHDDDIPEIVYPDDHYDDAHNMPVRWKDLLVSYISMNKPIAENTIKN